MSGPNICGVLVHARPEQVDAVRQRVETLPGTEVHTITDDGRLVVTVEEDETTNAGDTVLALHRLEGVLNASLVYHHFEPDEQGSKHWEFEDATEQA
ncbi:MAG: chaperone NapD [Alphaproteobacteria bacterium]|jgi:nitrate reductase NapD|nr:chaperone NapD [Alphaproteobacteria bacterium]MDP6813864.1 chaperone NapD [Alphaproteobacteria bacterium]